MFSLGMKKGANLPFVPLISCGGVWKTNDTNKWGKDSRHRVNYPHSYSRIIE